MITFTRAALGLGCAALTLAATAATASAAEEPDSTTDVNASIVWVDVFADARVEVPLTDGSSTAYTTSVGGYCTGFFVSETGDIATAGHCVEFNESDEIRAIRNVLVALQNDGYDVTGLDANQLDWDVTIDTPVAHVGQPSGIPDGIFSGESMVVAQIVDYQPFGSGDNALLRVADLSGTPALPVSAVTPVVGDEVVSIGFPGSVSDISDVQRQLPSYKSGSVSSRQYSATGVPNTEIDAAVSQGMSGGPTLNAVGEVIGINSFGPADESQSFNFVTDTQTLRDFLIRNGVELAAATSGGSPSSGTDGSAVPVSDQSAPSAQPAQSGTSPLIWVLGLTVVTLLGGLVLVIARLQKNGRAPAAQQPQPLYPVATAVPQSHGFDPTAAPVWQHQEQPTAQHQQEAPLAPWR